MGTNVSTNFITCPADANKTLGIKLPFLVMIIKNVSICSCFSPASIIVEEVLHIRGASAGRQEREEKIQSLQLPKHHQSEALHLHDAHEVGRRVEPDPVQLVWLHKESLRNQLHWNASVSCWCFDNCYRNRVQIHANCRIRRIYFSDRLYTEDELPPEFKLFLPVAGKTNAQWFWILYFIYFLSFNIILIMASH